MEYKAEEFNRLITEMMALAKDVSVVVSILCVINILLTVIGL